MSLWWVTAWVSWIPLDTPGYPWVPGCLAKPVDAIPWSKSYCLLPPAERQTGECHCGESLRPLHSTSGTTSSVLVEPLVAQLVVLAPLAEPAVNVIPPDASSPGEATGILGPILKVESTLWMPNQPQENISLQSSVTNFWFRIVSQVFWSIIFLLTLFIKFHKVCQAESLTLIFILSLKLRNVPLSCALSNDIWVKCASPSLLIFEKEEKAESPWERLVKGLTL